MKQSIQLTSCGSWSEAVALRFMLDAEGLVAVATLGHEQNHDRAVVASFAPDGYPSGLLLAARLFSLLPEEQMRKEMTAMVNEGLVRRNEYADLLSPTRREEMRRVLTKASVGAFNRLGGSTKRQEGQWVEPIKPIVDHDPGDEDTLPDSARASLARLPSRDELSWLPPDPYDGWKPAR